MAYQEELSAEATINRLVVALLDLIQKTEDARLVARTAEAREASARHSSDAKRRLTLGLFEEAAAKLENWRQRHPTAGWSEEQQTAFNEAAGLIRMIVKEEREKLEAGE